MNIVRILIGIMHRFRMLALLLLLGSGQVLANSYLEYPEAQSLIKEMVEQHGFDNAELENLLAGAIRKELGLLGKDLDRLDQRVGNLDRHFGQAGKDIEEIKDSYLKGLTFHFVKEMGEVLCPMSFSSFITASYNNRERNLNFEH